MTLRALGQVEDHGLDPLVHRRLPAEPELQEDRVDHLLNRPFRQNERFGDRRVVLALGHLAQHVALARRQLSERRFVVAGGLRHQGFDHLRIDHRTALRDSQNRAGELVEILDSLLEEVRTASAPTLQQRQDVLRVRVLAEDDDADLRMPLAQALGRLYALIRATRRHTYVGDDDVRPLGIDCGEKRCEVVTRCDDSKVLARLEQPANAFPDALRQVRGT